MVDRRPDPSIYSRWVAVLKIAFPLIAIALLSTVFLVPREDKIEGGLVFTKIDIATLGDGLTISNPRFSGITNSGDTFTITAKRAIPDAAKPTKIEMADITAHLTFSDGLLVDVAAPFGVARLGSQVLEIEGELTASGSNQYSFKAEGGVFDLRSGTYESDGPVQLDGPGQHLTAEKMTVRPSDTGNGHIFLFENKVQMSYAPKTASE